MTVAPCGRGETSARETAHRSRLGRVPGVRFGSRGQRRGQLSRSGPARGCPRRGPRGGSIDDGLGADVMDRSIRVQGGGSVGTIGCQARGESRGGRKVDVARRKGWRESVLSMNRVGDAGSGAGRAVHQAQRSARMRIVPRGTTGTVGLSPHHAPRQGAETRASNPAGPAQRRHHFDRSTHVAGSWGAACRSSAPRPGGSSRPARPRARRGTMPGAESPRGLAVEPIVSDGKISSYQERRSRNPRLSEGMKVIASCDPEVSSRADG